MDTVFYTLEYMTRNARTQANVFKRICDYWGIAFDKKMLTFGDRFGENFLYRNEQERGIYASNPKGLFTEVMEAKGICSNRRIPVSFNRTRHSGLPLSLGLAYEAIHRATVRLHEGNQHNRPKQRGWAKR